MSVRSVVKPTRKHRCVHREAQFTQLSRGVARGQVKREMASVVEAEQRQPTTVQIASLSSAGTGVGLYLCWWVPAAEALGVAAAGRGRDRHDTRPRSAAHRCARADE